jgi:hypothetical protein
MSLLNIQAHNSESCNVRIVMRVLCDAAAASNATREPFKMEFQLA